MSESMKHIVTRLLFFSVFLIFLAGCSDSEDPVQNDEGAAPDQKEVGFVGLAPKDAQKLIQERQNLIFLDIRTDSEYKQGAIEGARHVPMMQIIKGDATFALGEPILLYCAVGGRSFGIGQLLRAKGHKEIYHIEGGIVAWSKAGLPVIYP